MTAKHELRMRIFCAAGLYVVTSESSSRGRKTIDIIRASLAGGARLVQLREKELSTADLLALAREARALTAQFGALLIINDRLDVALAAEADGVHLGQTDLPVADARRLAPDLIVGASTHSAEEALRAQSQGASYINIGPIFPTNTKKWQAPFLGIEGFRNISRLVSVPCTVMGGIKKHHVRELLNSGARTIALVTAVSQADDPEQAVRDLLTEIVAPRRPVLQNDILRDPSK